MRKQLVRGKPNGSADRYDSLRRHILFGNVVPLPRLYRFRRIRMSLSRFVANKDSTSLQSAVRGGHRFSFVHRMMQSVVENRRVKLVLELESLVVRSQESQRLRPMGLILRKARSISCLLDSKQCLKPSCTFRPKDTSC